MYFKVKYHTHLFIGDPNNNDCTLLIAIVYISSYYAKSITNDTYIWMFMILCMGVFIECQYGFKMEMGASTLYVIMCILLSIKTCHHRTSGMDVLIYGSFTKHQWHHFVVFIWLWTCLDWKQKQFFIQWFLGQLRR